MEILAAIIWPVFVVGAICFFLWLAKQPSESDKIEASVHRQQTKQFSKKGAIEGNFDAFVREFAKRDWEWGGHRKSDHSPNGHPDSFFDYDNDSQVHASIYCFNGVGMLLNIGDFLKSREYLKMKRKEEESKLEAELKWS